jgi:hypothetical protein
MCAKGYLISAENVAASKFLIGPLDSLCLWLRAAQTIFGVLIVRQASGGIVRSFVCVAGRSANHFRRSARVSTPGLTTAGPIRTPATGVSGMSAGPPPPIRATQNVKKN